MMKRRYYLIVFILFLSTLSLSLNAQEEDESLKQSFRWNPVRLATGTFQLEFEQEVAQDFTLSFMGMGTYAAENGLGGWYLDRLKERENYKAKNMSGLGLIVQGRYYLFDAMDEPKGLYVGPHVMARNLWVTYEADGNGSTVNDDKTSSTLSIYAGGAMFGVQWPIFSQFVVDAYAGPVLRLSNYGYEEGPSNYNAWTAVDHSGVTLHFGLSFGFVK